MSAATGESVAVVVRNLFQPILDVARTSSEIGNKGEVEQLQGKREGKGQVGMCRGCANHAHPKFGGKDYDVP